MFEALKKNKKKTNTKDSVVSVDQPECLQARQHKSLQIKVCFGKASTCTLKADGEKGESGSVSPAVAEQ